MDIRWSILLLSSFLPILSADDVANPNNCISPNIQVPSNLNKMVITQSWRLMKISSWETQNSRVQYNFVGDTATRTLGLLSGEYNVTES